jgi:hypothetical protein
MLTRPVNGLSKEDPMKRHAILAGIAGTMLIAGFSGGALAQAKYYEDGTNCSLLSDAELVACQNQIYARQLQSGESYEATGPNDQTIVPGSNPDAADESASTIVPGAETNPPLIPLVRPEDVTPGVGEPLTLPGPEGTIGGADGGTANPQ